MSAPRRSHKPVVHLFVGLHKTGSSAIRLMLDFHGSMLDRHGFPLPRAGWTRYINGFWNGGHNNVPWEICDWDLQNLQTVRKHQFRVVRAGAVVVAAAGRVAGRACWALAG
mgnify:CR=1 FL=1